METGTPDTNSENKLRIAVAGIHIESSTFTPYTSSFDDFEVNLGPKMLGRYPFLDSKWTSQVEWLPILHARALPGGVVDAKAYEQWKDQILTGLAKAQEDGPLDGLLFDIHGAMNVEGLDDAEGDLITAIRQAIGDAPLVSASMDLHGNVSDALFDGCDLLTCYRTAPHIDTAETRERAARLLVTRLLNGQGKPAKALAFVPVLLPGEKTSTRLEPAKSLYDMVPEVEATPGILDAAIWVGFAWADEPRSTASIVVTGDDAEVVRDKARLLAQSFWDVRNEFDFVAPSAPLEEVLEWAKTAKRPTVISDSGDNPGAGGADDVTFTLARLLEWEPAASGDVTTLVASLTDPEVTSQAVEAGVGGKFTTTLGGKIDTTPPGPLAVQAEVLHLSENDRGGHVATLKVTPAKVSPAKAVPARINPEEVQDHAGLTVIVTQNRDQYASLDQYLAAGVDPRAFDVVTVKIGYLEPDLYALANDWMIALTPGGVDQDLLRLNHQRVSRPLFPFDQDFEWSAPVRLVQP